MIGYGNKKIWVLPGVYKPAEDSFLMVEAVLKELRPSDRVLEIGAGSGIVSAFIKDRASVIAIDISPCAVKCAKLNGIDVIRADLFDGIKGRFDLIVFNPPYLPSGEKIGDWLDFAWDGGEDGQATINRFLRQVKDCLTENGRFLLLVSSLSGVDAIMERMTSLGFIVEELLSERYFFERLVVLRGRMKE
ncbi:MAG: class I SAM-dependent methyltransferase [Methanocellales archaeon]|nr:class I SAM-dependent methyltransferase [Methanocellales archaeon]